MTLEELMACKKNFVNVEDIAEIIELSPQTIRDQANEDPRALGFPVTRAKSRVRVSRIGFINFTLGGRYEN